MVLQRLRDTRVTLHCDEQKRLYGEMGFDPSLKSQDNPLETELKGEHSIQTKVYAQKCEARKVRDVSGKMKGKPAC